MKTADLLTWDHERTHQCWPHEWELRWMGPMPPESVKEKWELDWYWCVVCSKCDGARCDAWTAGAAIRCTDIRHHRRPHQFPDDTQREVGR